jgi:DNA-binding transcriptional ArsR family regulator
MAKLEDLFISRVRVKLIQIFLSQPQEIFYVRQLVRLAEEEINAVRRELARMEERGMVKKEQRGNRLYYFFRKDYPYYQDLISLVAKNTGLGAEIIKDRHKLGQVRYAMLSGRFVRHMARKSDEDIDLLIVGNLNLPFLTRLVRQAESQRETEINYAPMSPDEFSFRKSRRDPFLQKILSAGRVMLIGDEEEMVS